MRHLSALDTCIDFADQSLRRMTRQPASRPRPDRATPPTTLTTAERATSGRLMRVNHSGEIAAQALYHGQALACRDPAIRQALRSAAREEGDHLAWTQERLGELEARPSLLGPLWYFGSLALGLAAGAAGDRWSLGFIAETEQQVTEHLSDQMQRLPAADDQSRAILGQMRTEEAGHATRAVDAGGHPLPLPVRLAMRLASQVMVRTSYWI